MSSQPSTVIVSSSSTSADVAAVPFFTVTSFSPVFVSAWERETDICSICRNHVEGPCVVCQANAETAQWDCPIAWGMCNHAFHAHCVHKWLRTRNVCPLDNKPWEERTEWATGSTVKGEEEEGN